MSTTAGGRAPLCPNCPLCGSEPPWIFSTMAQAFCINEECNVLCWDPWSTAKQNLDDMHEAVETENPLQEPTTGP